MNKLHPGPRCSFCRSACEPGAQQVGLCPTCWGQTALDMQRVLIEGRLRAEVYGECKGKWHRHKAAAKKRRESQSMKRNNGQ